MFEMIFSGVMTALCALMMICIGVSQCRRKTPVGFYTFEKAPTAEEIRDVKRWNNGHGMMLIVYGAVMLIAWGAMQCIEGIAGFCVWIAGILLPIPVMILYHRSLVKKYMIRG